MTGTILGAKYAQTKNKKYPQTLKELTLMEKLDTEANFIDAVTAMKRSHRTGW